MKDRLKKKLKAKKISQQAGSNAAKNLPQQYKKYLESMKAATSKVESRLQDDESGKQKQISGSLDSAMKTVEKLYILIKHQMPHLFEEFKKTVVQDFTPEEKQEFFDKIAHLEATKLDDILAGKD